MDFFVIYGDDNVNKHLHGTHYIPGTVLRASCFITSFDLNNPMDKVILPLYFADEKTEAQGG